MSKLVSIILPTYNGQSFLKQSIESCLNQTYKNIELIVVNDCSTDNTEEIILRYADSRLRYVKNETNQRLPRSLNIGFTQAKGDYFTWTSDDNYFKEDAVARLVETLESNNSDLVYANYKTIDDHNQITGQRVVGPRENILLDNVVKACFLYKKEVHDKLGGYDPSLFLVEDYDFWIRAAYHDFKFTPIHEILYFYRFHDNSLTESRRVEISAALWGLLQSHVDLFYIAGKHEFITGQLYLRLAKLAIANKSFTICKSFLKKALAADIKLLFSKDFLKNYSKILLK